MKHVRIATYEIKRGSFQELADVAQDGMLREFRNQPGFIRYGLADSGDKTCVSLSLWETRKDADHAVDVSAAWDRAHIADRAELRTSQVVDLAFYEGVPAKV
jgi:heme-degrading monooxygenase HmoA